MRDKFKLTEHLVSELPSECATNLETAKNTWWFNLRPGGGLRLTDAGFKALSDQLKIDFYAYKIPDELMFTQATIIELDRKLQNPYYIVTKKNLPIDIIFFSSKEAMLVNLYGDLQKFLNNYR